MDTHTCSALEINQKSFDHIVRMIRKAGREHYKRYVYFDPEDRSKGNTIIHFRGSEVALVRKKVAMVPLKLRKKTKSSR